MAISVVQRAIGTDTAGSNNTLSAVFGSNVTSGNAIIVIAFHSQADNSSFTTPTDTRGNTYAQVYDHNLVSSFTGIRVWVVYNTSAGADTVTMAPDGNNPTSIVCLEVTGLASTFAFDKSVQNDQQSTGSLSTGSVSTAFANELLLGIFMTDGGSSPTWTLGTGYSNKTEAPTDDLQAMVEEKIVSSTGSYSATATTTINNTNTLAVLLTFSDTAQPINSANLVAGSNFTAAGAATYHGAASPVAGSILTSKGGINFTDSGSLVAGANLAAILIQVVLDSASLVAGSVLTARPATVWLGAAALVAGSVFQGAGQVQGINNEKVFEYKVFDHGTGAYLGSLPDVISDYDYNANVNTPGNAIQVELGRTPDFLAEATTALITQDTSEKVDTEASEDILVVTDSGAQVGSGTAVDLNLDIEVWVYYGYEDDLVDETGAPVVDENGTIVGAPAGAPKGLRLFSGYVSAYDIRYGGTETVLLSCLPNGAELNNYVLLAGDGVTVSVPYHSVDPSDIIRGGMDSYNTQGGSLAYDDSTIANTITVVSYDFKLDTVLQVIQKAQELAPTNWWWYGDPATNKLIFQPIPADVTHTFVVGKHIKDLDIKKSMENIVNDYYFLGGDTANDPAAPVYLFHHANDATSITNYRRGLVVKTDGRITDPDSADIIMNSDITANKNPRYQGSCVVLANQYEIETIEMGQLVGFANAGNDVDTLQLQIVGLHYQPDYVTLKLDSLLPQPSKRLEDIKRNLVQLQTLSVPDAPS